MGYVVPLPPDTSLGAVHLTVSNLDRSLTLYGDVLGLKHQAQGGVVSLTADGTTPLVLLTEQPDAQPKPARSTGLYHFAILLPGRGDLARALQRLVEKRYPLQGAADHLVSEAIYLADPDGNGIELYADRSRSAWPRRDGQLQMATDPLDVEGLLAEANRDGGAWDGLPVQTTIGHIHLQVADLRQAEAFYCDLLGFDLVARYGPSALFVSAGGYHHHIGLNTWAGVGAPPPPPGAVGLRDFTLCLPGKAELDRMVEHIKLAGVGFQESAGAIYLQDPAGNGIRLVAGKRLVTS